MKQTREELIAIINAARLALDKIQKDSDRKRNAGMLGKCFKYPDNCYSCPKTKKDYWPVYYKIVEAGDLLTALEFQTDCFGGIDIKFDKYFILSDRHVPIKASEFRTAWRKMQAKIAKIKP